MGDARQRSSPATATMTTFGIPTRDQYEASDATWPSTLTIPTRATQWTQSGSASTTFSTVAASAAAAARSLHAHHANLLHSAAAAVYQIPNTEHMAYRLVRSLVYMRGVGI